MPHLPHDTAGFNTAIRDRRNRGRFTLDGMTGRTRSVSPDLLPPAPEPDELESAEAAEETPPVPPGKADGGGREAPEPLDAVELINQALRDAAGRKLGA